ncbi:MAG: C45 family peptidase [Verrucomicrobiota bacterium]
MKRIVAILVLFGLTGCGYAAKEALFKNPRVQSILDKPTYDRTITHTGTVATVGSDEDAITVLYVTGTPYEMGYEHGKLLAAQVRATISDVEAGELRLLPKVLRTAAWLSGREKKDIINDLLDRAWEELRPYTPRDDLEEMAGLAAGSGVPLRVIHRMHAIPDLGETSCSGMVAFGDATRDHHVYQLRILDYGANFGLQQRPLITVYRPLDGQPFINIGWIGFIGVISGVNRAGVGLSEMGFGNPPGETLRGTPMPFLLKNVLRYANSAPEGATLIRAAPRTNSYIYFLGDRQGHALGLITSAQHCEIHAANELDKLTVGKHVLPQFKDLVYAGHYDEKQAELTGQLQGTFDLATLQDLSRQIAMKSNLHTVIYDLTAAKFWVANRKDTTRAADRPYVEFDAGAAWH